LGSIDINHIRNFTKKEETYSQLARTEVVVQSALAFAGSSFALSRPIRNNFVIVKGQRGLKGTDLVINPDGSGNYVAKTTNFSPAIHPYLSPYRLSNIRVEPANPPIGATPPKINFTLFPSYKSGTLLSLGQDIQIIAIGRMLNSQHQPVANKSFEIKPAGKDGGKSIRVFTSRTGRFQAGGLQPGLYRIIPSSKSIFKAQEFKIPETTKDIVQLGNIVLSDVK
jgi:outer membrane usher protein